MELLKLALSLIVAVIGILGTSCLFLLAGAFLVMASSAVIAILGAAGSITGACVLGYVALKIMEALDE